MKKITTIRLEQAIITVFVFIAINAAADNIAFNSKGDCTGQQGGDYHYDSTIGMEACCNKGDSFKWMRDANGDWESCCNGQCEPAQPA